MDNEYYKSCTKCGRPQTICKGECCGKPRKACIRQTTPSCCNDAVIPTVTVATIADMKGITNALVHVAENNTTYYVDGRGNIIITWAGQANIPGYDMEANPRNLRNQIVTDVEKGIAVLYDAFGHPYMFGLSESMYVEEEVSKKLNEMVEDGTLESLLSPYYVDFEENEDDNTAIDENFKSISCEYMRFRDNYVRIFHIKNFSDLAVVPTSGAAATPQTGATNIKDLSANNTTYNFYVNGGAFDGDTKEPIGYCIFDGVGYTPSTVPSSWGYYCCFDGNNNLFIKKQTETPSISNLINSGAVNAFLTFQALKINGVDESSAETGVAIRQIIAQKTDGSYLVIYTDGRFYNSPGLTYGDCTDLINAIDPTIENAIALDGGGSVQTFYNGYSLIPHTDSDHFLGRVVPTALGFKIGE